MQTLNDILNSNQYSSTYETCHGCENHCAVRCFHFANGSTFFSGNNCEKIYSNRTDSTRQGTNMFAEKYKLLFHRENCPPVLGGRGIGGGGNKLSTLNSKLSTLKIGLPRALGIYENYPFWHALFSYCGIKVMLSQLSTNTLYERGIHTVMADNICFPAKLMHGHIYNLITRGVDRIFYPYVVYEQKEDKLSANSFNCPIVSGYSDVIRSAIDPSDRHSIALDSPTISFNNSRLLTKSCCEYLTSLGVDKDTAIAAVAVAQHAQNEYKITLANRNNEVLQRAVTDHRMVILLAGHPYHIDPLIEHKISHAIADMGVDVITTDIAFNHTSSVFNEINSLSQWAYPNRIFKAAHFVGNHPYSNLHFVELTSFGCGPDAFILDEVGSLLRRYDKNLTILKIDDVNNIGSLRLRIRSLVESSESKATKYCPPNLEQFNESMATQYCPPVLGGRAEGGGGIFNSQSSTLNSQSTPIPFQTTKTFQTSDRQRTILAPYFAEGYSEFLPSLMKVAGYRLVNLPVGSQSDAEAGLKYANNDVCYPATIVIGSIMNALKSGKYDLDNTAVVITQTGGQCRASNYMALIKNALTAEGFSHVPVISFALGAGLHNTQPGFQLPIRRMARITLHTLLYADCLAKLYHSSVVRAKSEISHTDIKNLYSHYITESFSYIERRDTDGLISLLSRAVCDFSSLTDYSRRVPVIGLVGEIYVKYNNFSNKNVIPWLIEQGVEVVPPSLVGFFSTAFVNTHVNRKQNIKAVATTSRLVSDALHHYVLRTMRRYDAVCRPYPFYRPFTDIFDNARLASDIINLAADFGEGWFLPGEICHLAHSGVNNVISLQPFGCIANHVISKGIEKRLKRFYPNLNLLFLDFDSGTSEANVFNRLHFILRNTQNELKNIKNS